MLVLWFMSENIRLTCNSFNVGKIIPIHKH